MLVRERYFLVRTATRRVTNAHQPDDERRVYHERLADLLAPILAGNIPARLTLIGPPSPHLVAPALRTELRNERSLP